MPGLNRNQNERGKPPIVSFIGTANSGKTTLLKKVVAELKLKGYRVAVIKHTHHDFDIDQIGKDTWWLAQAGSDIVAVSSPNKVAFIERVDIELTLEQIVELIGGNADIVLTEGYKNCDTAKIVVRGNGREQLYYEGETLATVSTHLSSSGRPQFNDEDVVSIVNLLVKQIVWNPSRYKLERLLVESA